MRLPVIIGVLLLSLVAGTAQVTVDIMLDQEQYLRDESLPVKVRITNRSGRALKLGATADWLNFTVENREGHNVARLGDLPVKEEFTVESSMVATRTVDIAPFFNVGLPGRYTVSAEMKIPEWNQQISSKPRNFSITRGAPLWEQIVGLPGTGSAVPELRKYVLQQANVKHLTLYVRITDESEHKTFKLVPVGQMVSFSRPEPQVDKESNLHLLFQSGARSFVYAVVTPAGEIILRQRHDYAGTRPTLRSGDDGRIGVAGGQRFFSRDDVPPPIAIGSTNNVSAVTP
jgi:hypothetical protein